MIWEFAGSSHRGRVRLTNEDAYSTRYADKGAFVVADGLGGRQGSALASRIACDCAARVLSVSCEHAAAIDLDRLARDAMRAAHEEVRRRADLEPAVTKMACTIVALRLWCSSAIVAHAGDARAYLWRSGTLRQLTKDHTEVAALVARGALTQDEARFYPFRHRVCRAIGGRHAAADVSSVSLRDRDRLLLCTDGLWGMVDELRLAEILGDGHCCGTCVDRMISEANSAGGSDNITAIVIHVRGGNDGLGF